MNKSSKWLLKHKHEMQLVGKKSSKSHNVAQVVKKNLENSLCQAM